MTACSNCVISRTEYSFLSQQSVMRAPAKRARFLYPNRISELVWDSESNEAGPLATASLRTREVLKTPRGVTPATRPPNIQCSSVQQFVLVKCLWWRGLFQSRSEQQVQTPSPSQWTRPSVSQSSVVHTFTEAPGGKEIVKRHISVTGLVHLAFPIVFCRNYYTAGGGDWQIVPRPPWQNWRGTFTPTWRDWRRNACVSCDKNTMVHC